MADSKSAEIEQLNDREIYHTQARAGNRIKQVMARIHMEIKGLDARRSELERQYSHLEEALELQKFSPLNIGRRELPERTHSNHLGLCNEIPLPMPEQTPVTMTFDIEASKSFFGIKAEQIIIPWKLSVRESYVPAQMFGLDWFDSINEGARFPDKVEGHWRKSPHIPEGDNNEDPDFPFLPYPVVYTPHDFDFENFTLRLNQIEQHDDTVRTLYRGITAHRWTGVGLGCGEFELDGWSWPDSLSVYLEAGVPPSRAFFQFIMQQHAQRWPERNTMETSLALQLISELPKYGR